MSGDWWLIAATVVLLLGLGYFVVPAAIGIIMGSHFWYEAVREEPAASTDQRAQGRVVRIVGGALGLVMISTYAGLAAWLFGWLDPWVAE